VRRASKCIGCSRHAQPSTVPAAGSHPRASGAAAAKRTRAKAQQGLRPGLLIPCRPQAAGLLRRRLAACDPYLINRTLTPPPRAGARLRGVPGAAAGERGRALPGHQPLPVGHRGLPAPPGRQGRARQAQPGGVRGGGRRAGGGARAGARPPHPARRPPPGRLRFSGRLWALACGSSRAAGPARLNLGQATMSATGDARNAAFP